MIERIRIRNYRSLRDVEVKLEPLTVLIGRSGSGKSNFVRAVRLLRDFLGGRIDMAAGQYWGHLATAMPYDSSDGGLLYDVEMSLDKIKRLRYEIEFVKGSAAVALERLTANGVVVFHQHRNDWIVRPKGAEAPRPKELAINLLSGIREVAIASTSLGRALAFYDFPTSILLDNISLERTPEYDGPGEPYLTLAGRIFDLMLSGSQDWDLISGSMSVLNTQLHSLDFHLPKRDRLQAGYVLRGETRLSDVRQESEGFRRYLAHLLALYQTPPKQTSFFEHPESGIHPGALESLANEFTAHVRRGRGQVVLTTHSPQLLDYFDPDSVRVVDVQDGVTQIGPLSPEQTDAVKEQLLRSGELLTVDPARLAGQLAEVGG